MPLSRRYTPEIAPLESSIFGMDFSPVIPPGVGISSGQLDIILNTQPPQTQSDITWGAVSVHDRTLYARVTATASAIGRDYQLVWVANDTDGNSWPRSGLVLCAYTS